MSAAVDRLVDLDARRAGRREDRTLALTPASSITPQRARWAYAGRVPLGAVTLFVGREGLGKTTVLMNWAASATRGELPGDLASSAATVIYATAEDSIETTLVPRFLAAHGDAARLSFLDVQIDYGDGEINPGSLTLPDDVDQLRRILVESAARLLVLDPLVAYLPNEVNAHKDQHVRRVLGPLARLAADLDLAVLAVLHLNKSDSGDALQRVGGSVGLTAAARSVLMLGRDPDDPEGERGAGRVIAHAKCNVGPLAPSLTARIEKRVIEAPAGPIETSVMVVLGETTNTAGDLLSSATRDELSARSEARAFLEAELAEGPKSATDVKVAAGEIGISESTLNRTKRDIGVRSIRPGGRGAWLWQLPDHLARDPGDLGHLDHRGHQEPLDGLDDHAVPGGST